jgi:hypothetical protein
VKVHGAIDEDGFYYGEIQGGRFGLVPSNMVIEIDRAKLLFEPAQPMVQRLGAYEQQRRASEAAVQLYATGGNMMDGMAAEPPALR